MAENPGMYHVTALKLRTGGERFRELWNSIEPMQIREVDADYHNHPSGDIFLNVGINKLMRSLNSSVLVSPVLPSPTGPRPFRTSEWES